MTEIQAEEGNATSYAPPISDLSQVVISRYGVNLAVPPENNSVYEGITTSYNMETGIFSVKGKTKRDFTGIFILGSEYMPETMKIDVILWGNSGHTMDFYSYTGLQPVDFYGSVQNTVFENLRFMSKLNSRGTTLEFQVALKAGDTVEISFRMVWKLSTVTAEGWWTPGKQNFIPSKAGIVTEMTSFSPYMTVAADTPGH